MAGNTIRINAELNDGVSKKLNNISNAFDKLGGKGSGASLFGNVGAAAISGGFSLIGDAASKATEFMLDSVDAASKLEQAMGGVESVFGKTADEIKKFANSAAESVGLSKREVFEFASVIGAKLEGLGFSADNASIKTQSLIQRAADMAATFGGPTSDAVEAISALLTGETDPIEKYGVSIKQADIQARILAEGLDTSTTAAKKNSTATAALELLYEQTGKTTGQFAKQSDTLAEKQQIANAKMENAQALIGQRLQPVFENLSSFMITDVIPAIDAFGRGFDKAAKFIAEMIARLNQGIKKVHDFMHAIDSLIPKINGISTAPPIPGLPIPHFAQGGTVPGPLNSPQLIVAHGGETVVPTSRSGGGGGFTIQGVSEREILDMVDRGLYFRLQRAAPTGGRV